MKLPLWAGYLLNYKAKSVVSKRNTLDMSTKTFTSDDSLLNLKELEFFISSKAKMVKDCRYAFCVILPEEKYKRLLNLYKQSNSYYANNIDEYPWCHLKLLTETYVRKSGKTIKGEEQHLEILLAKEIGVKRITYWDKIQDIIRKLKLEIVRDEGGSWCIYANVILHAGVPLTYFEDIFKITQKEFKNCNGNLDSTINNLCDKKDIFKYAHFSRYFKEAFDDENKSPLNKKRLFRWFAKLVDISRRGYRLDIKLKEYFPPHLINCIKDQGIDNNQEKENYNTENIQNQKRKLEPQSGLIFNQDRGEIAYLISSNSLGLKGLETNKDFPSHWKKALEYVTERKSAILSLPVRPLDLTSEIVYSNYRTKIFNSSVNETVEAIIFDSNYKVISPQKKEISINQENDSLLTIITREKCSDLQKKWEWIMNGIFPTWKNPYSLLYQNLTE